MKASHKVPTSPSIGLPAISIDRTTYFVNLALRILRKAFDPHGHVDFDSVEGVRLCRLAGVVTCSRCGMSAIVALSDREDVRNCMRCRERLGA